MAQITINGVVLLIGVNGVTYNDNLPNKKELIYDLVKKYPKKIIIKNCPKITSLSYLGA